MCSDYRNSDTEEVMFEVGKRCPKQMQDGVKVPPKKVGSHQARRRKKADISKPPTPNLGMEEMWMYAVTHR